MRVGIIANPESGRDVRRIVSGGFVFTNEEKTNIISRLFSSFDYFGIKEVLYMKDSFGIVERAYNNGNFKFKIRNVLNKPTFTREDSTNAARIMNREDVDIIVVLGGDGTNRDVAEGCDDTPILPISTGTNNVFPFFIEGTIAGLSTSIFVKFKKQRRKFLRREKRIEIKSKDLNTISLVDLSFSGEEFVGSKAVWSMENIKHIFLTQAYPWNIGISSIGGILEFVDRYEEKGLYIKLGGGKNFLSPVLPGKLLKVEIEYFKTLKLKENTKIYHKGTMVLDGERFMEIYREKEFEIKITKRGPLTLDYKNLLLWATREKILKILGRY